MHARLLTSQRSSLGGTELRSSRRRDSMTSTAATTIHTWRRGESPTSAKSITKSTSSFHRMRSTSQSSQKSPFPGTSTSSTRKRLEISMRRQASRGPQVSRGRRVRLNHKEILALILNYHSERKEERRANCARTIQITHSSKMRFAKKKQDSRLRCMWIWRTALIIHHVRHSNSFQRHKSFTHSSSSLSFSISRSSRHQPATVSCTM